MLLICIGLCVQQSQLGKEIMMLCMTQDQILLPITEMLEWITIKMEKLPEGI